MSARHLTKSRFKIGAECATKLAYHDDPSYGSTKIDNTFLKALADGGFQVGELAKLYHPGGTEITTRDKAKAIAETNALLAQENVVIYEAAFIYDNLYIKADIVIKRGNNLELIEVKSKSFDPDDEEGFFTKTSIKKGKPELSSKWESYVFDLAFQTHVVRKSHPKLTVLPFLMLADKSKLASVDGLNQKFFLEKVNDKETRVIVKPGTTLADLGEKILAKVDALEATNVAFEHVFADNLTFHQKISQLSDVIKNNTWTPALISANCKSCEFRIGSDLKKKGLKSGFEKCWSHTARMKPADFDRPMIFDIWNFRQSEKYMQAGLYYMDQLNEDDFKVKEKDEPGLSNPERQWLQVDKAAKRDSTAYFDHEGLAEEMKSWKYPLHFIDFETTMAAIPFNKGRRPYEQTAFQFSHHIVTEQGEIRHETEYINREKGKFPNFDFVRALKRALENDDGTIFRYAAHENTVLNQIKAQLEKSNEEDAASLINFIDSITTSGEKKNRRVGPRAMVDMLEVVRKYYFHPLMLGSNSIKKVLPAILSSSKFLQEKYAQPDYGSKIPSKNFKDWKWVQIDDEGNIKDPYEFLPPVFSDLDLATMDSLITESSLADGGAAMTAYARMQFTEMTDAECDRVTQALLKYCELDTFAMVMIWEHWLAEISTAAGDRSVQGIK